MRHIAILWWRPAALVIGLLGLAWLAWWWLGSTRVEERVREESIEMIDISEPPPPPPPPPVQPEELEEIPPEDAAPSQTVQADPLSPVQPAATNPPAGDIASLLQDPVADAGAFVGGPRGQGGTGNGPLIGGSGGGGGNQASRAYADNIKNALMRHVRRDRDLAKQNFRFLVRVRVNSAGKIDLADPSGVTPPNLRDEIIRAVRGFSTVDRPPPAGGPVPFFATILLSQS